VKNRNRNRNGYTKKSIDARTNALSENLSPRSSRAAGELLSDSDSDLGQTIIAYSSHHNHVVSIQRKKTLTGTRVLRSHENQKSTLPLSSNFELLLALEGGAFGCFDEVSLSLLSSNTQDGVYCALDNLTTVPPPGSFDLCG
jgi:hypothetical protein